MAIVVDVKGIVASADYPRLMKSTVSGAIVLFHKPEQGTVLACDDDAWNVGETCLTWAMSNFEDFHGSITFSNK